MPRFETNQIDVNGDGRVIIYLRPDVKGTPKWQMRISVPKSTGYFRGSTGEVDEVKARVAALNKYQELAIKVLSGGTLKAKTFQQLFNEFEKGFPKSMRAKGKSPNFVKQHLLRIRNYPLRFFGSRRIDELKKADFEEYWVWRVENAMRRNPHKEELTPYTPSNNTLRYEGTSLNHLFEFAVDKGWLVSAPEIKKPPLDKARRPTFTLAEYRILTRQMREWVKEGEKWGSVGRDRFVVQQNILILANSGARVGEVRTIKWGDLRTIKQVDSGTDNVVERLCAKVSGKTGSREVVFQEGSEVYVKNLFDLRTKELGRPPELNEFVICHPTGEPIGYIRGAWESLMDFTGLRFNDKGERRTLYSLRSFYATQRLQEEVSPYVLATNMGTSREMLTRFYGQPVTDLIARQITKSSFTPSKKQNDEISYPWEN